MNPDLDKLQPYPFERLAKLKAGITPPPGLPHITLSIGEPQHPTPGVITEALIGHTHGLANYPTTKGQPALRQAIAQWLTRRFDLPHSSVDAETQVIPVNGTREALFAFAQAVIDRRRPATVVMPNPFYQIYEGAALLAGAQPHYVNIDANGLADYDAVPPEVWKQCQLLYICTPGNPSGAVIGIEALQRLIRLADEYDFIIAGDECYSEIYPDEHNPPPGLLQAAAQMGRSDFKRCVVFHSLSKRSNAPGLRSGFVAGDAQVLEKFLKYRTYHGCAMSTTVQAASVAAWADEAHVIQNRRLYREKFDAVLKILQPVLEVQHPDAAFYLWLRTPIDGETFAQRLFAQQHVTVLPGVYLSRLADGIVPGADRVRIALVAPVEECIEAAGRIRDFITTL
ncbi:MAG: succinyldiaminopimelate transaminase [Pseudomonadota bacterium]